MNVQIFRDVMLRRLVLDL